MIIKNAIRCNICGDEIESKHRHDYVQCKCGACAVDGGHDYLRRCAKDESCSLGFYLLNARLERLNATRMSVAATSSMAANLYLCPPAQM